MTKERAIQQEREKTALSAMYFSDQDIPPSPAEPLNDDPHIPDDSTVPVIRPPKDMPVAQPPPINLSAVSSLMSQINSSTPGKIGLQPQVGLQPQMPFGLQAPLSGTQLAQNILALVNNTSKPSQFAPQIGLSQPQVGLSRVGLSQQLNGPLGFNQPMSQPMGYSQQAIPQMMGQQGIPQMMGQQGIPQMMGQQGIPQMMGQQSNMNIGQQVNYPPTGHRSSVPPPAPPLSKGAGIPKSMMRVPPPAPGLRQGAGVPKSMRNTKPYTPPTFKTECKFFKMGKCGKGDACTFIHNA